jgi:hypothetical protein
MSWVFNDYPTRASVVAARTTATEQRQAGGIVMKTTCLASCCRGGAAFGVLWSVWERTAEFNGQPCGTTRRWINCDVLMARRRFDWGYKSLNESMEPPYCSCPLSYLEMVPISSFGGSARWRDRVLTDQIRNAEVRRSKRAVRSSVASGAMATSRAFIRQFQLR